MIGPELLLARLTFSLILFFFAPIVSVLDVPTAISLAAHRGHRRSTEPRAQDGLWARYKRRNAAPFKHRLPGTNRQRPSNYIRDADPLAASKEKTQRAD